MPKCVGTLDLNAAARVFIERRGHAVAIRMIGLSCHPNRTMLGVVMNALKYGRYPGPMSNTERQRRFRERNPGYYGRLHRKLKQQGIVLMAAKRAALAAGLAEPVALSVACAVVYRKMDLLQAIAQAKRPLMLPAPVELLLIPGINAIPATHSRTARAAVEIAE